MFKKLKNEYDFVKTLINYFKEDKQFICLIADYYLNNTEESVDQMELSIIMESLIENKNNKYKTMNEAKFTLLRVQLECIKESLNDQKFLNDCRLGFIYMYDEYKSSKIVTDYYAKKLIENIIEENDIDLELMLHNQFDSKEKLQKMGINNYIINFVNIYDDVLSSYLSSNIKLAEELKNKINLIVNNWDKYSARDEAKRYNLMLQKVHEYMENREEELMTETNLIYYVGNELGIAKKIAKYDKVEEWFLNSILDELDDECMQDIINNSFIDRLNINNVKKIMIETLFSNKNNNQSLNSAQENKKSRILKFPLKKED